MAGSANKLVLPLLHHLLGGIVPVKERKYALCMFGELSLNSWLGCSETYKNPQIGCGFAANVIASRSE